MKDEREPVATDERVIRAVWTDFYDPALAFPVLAKAFLPRNDETDGISVFRAACVAKPEDVLAVFPEEKRDRYALVLLSVSDLAALGLSVQPAAIDAVAGHAVLPELNIVSWKADKNRGRELQKQLAALANAAVVRTPKT